MMRVMMRKAGCHETKFEAGFEADQEGMSCVR